jgi:hypothetical protein
MSTVIALPRRKLTVTDYHRMVRTGILTDDDHWSLSKEILLRWHLPDLNMRTLSRTSAGY